MYLRFRIHFEPPGIFQSQSPRRASIYSLDSTFIIRLSDFYLPLLEDGCNKFKKGVGSMVYELMFLKEGADTFPD